MDNDEVRTFIVTVAEIPQKEIEITIDVEEFEDRGIQDVIEDMVEDEYVDYIEQKDIKLLEWKEVKDDTPQTPRQV